MKSYQIFINDDQNRGRLLNFYIYEYSFADTIFKEENYSPKETVRKKIFTIEGESLVKTCHFSCAKI